MSTDFLSQEPINFDKLLDAGICSFEIKIDAGYKNGVSHIGFKDKNGLLEIFLQEDGTFRSMRRSGRCNSVDRLVSVVSKLSGQNIYSEYDARYWWKDEKDDWSQEERVNYKKRLITFVEGKPHDFKAGTYDLYDAIIAYKLFSKNIPAFKVMDERIIRTRIMQYYFDIGFVPKYLPLEVKEKRAETAGNVDPDDVTYAIHDEALDVAEAYFEDDMPF